MRNVLITGGAGYIGRQVVRRLAADTAHIGRLVATDVRDLPADQRPPGAVCETRDVRDPQLGALMAAHEIDTVVHLASIVTPTADMTRAFLYSVDVRGTQNVMEACLAANVRKVIITSSGAAYGYYADNPEWLAETDAIRGNEAFAYSHHKRLVEEMLASYRQSHPQLTQLIFRLCTVVGAGVSNQITAMFERPVVLGVSGAVTPFVFVWDQDVVECIYRGVLDDRGGIYNVAGDGTLTLPAIARRLGKRYVAIPPAALRTALAVLKRLGLTQYGPEQVDFLRYRPVLANRALKEAFGYTPQCTSAEAFEKYLAGRAGRG